MKFSKFLLAFTFLSLSSFIFSQNQELLSKKDDGTELEIQEGDLKEGYSSRIRIGADYTHVHMGIDGCPSFNGNLGGGQFSYEYNPTDAFYGGVKASWKQGKMHASSGKRSLLYIDAHERLGYTLSLDEYAIDWSFFTGIGYRYYSQKFTDKTHDHLVFRYNYIYIPVGMVFEYAPVDYFTLGVDFTWMPQAYPTVAIHPLGGARWILSNELANFAISIPLDFTFNDAKEFHLVVTPFYERWKDGHSKAKTSTGVPLGLPSNTYDFAGVDVNFGYSF